MDNLKAKGVEEEKHTIVIESENGYEDIFIEASGQAPSKTDAVEIDEKDAISFDQFQEQIRARLDRLQKQGRVIKFKEDKLFSAESGKGLAITRHSDDDPPEDLGADAN